MIALGANDWDWGLHGACFGGHHDLVDEVRTRLHLIIIIIDHHR
jgi:hypothetical protein